jgi:hypothetical protein
LFENINEHVDAADHAAADGPIFGGFVEVAEVPLLVGGVDRCRNGFQNRAELLSRACCMWWRGAIVGITSTARVTSKVTISDKTFGSAVDETRLERARIGPPTAKRLLALQPAGVRARRGNRFPPFAFSTTARAEIKASLELY